VVYNLVTRVREPGIPVQIQSTDAGNTTKIMETSDLNGEVAFMDVPPGNYMINPYPPVGWMGGGKMISVTAHDQSTYRLVLRKEIPLVHPANNSPVETPQPVLCWDVLPQALYYIVQVKDSNQVLVANPVVYTTCYTLDVPLQDGMTYTWSLAAAVDLNGESIGGSKSFTFTYHSGPKDVPVAPQTETTLTSFDTSTQFVFPAGTFTIDGVVTYEHPADPPPAVYPLANTQKAYEISSAAPLANDATYQVAIEYTPVDVSLIDPSTLALYYWDPAQSTWVREPTSQNSADTQTITANPTHFSLWSVMGETHRIFLPVTNR
jgi:hypothetical protein